MPSPPFTASPPGMAGSTYRALLKRHWRALGMLCCIAIILAAAGWGTLFYNLSEHRRVIRQGALQEAEILSRAYARQLFRSLEAIDQLTSYVKHGWEISGGDFHLEDVSRAGLFDRNSGIFISLFDERGELITSTIPNPVRVNVANEPYFQAQKQGKGQFYIGTARIGRISRTPIIPFSQRLDDAAGNFRGVVVASVVPSFFLSAYDEIVLGKHGFIAILSADYNVRLARIGQRIFLPGNQEQALTVQPTFNSPAGSALLSGDQWFSDGMSRYTGWQTTSGYGMLTLAGLDEQTVNARYEAVQGPAFRSAVISTITLAILTFISILVFLDVARRKAIFKAMQASYRMATEGAAEGFLIATPVKDGQGTVVDFRVADCNDRGAQFLGYRRQDLLGLSVAEAYHGKPARLVRRLLLKAHRHGDVESEVNPAQWHLAGPAWLNVRVVRTEGNLAVTIRNISDTKAHIAELQRRGNEDALTELPNRNWVNGYLPAAIGKASANGTMMALLFLDLDEFKLINDTMGHEAGDETLRVVGQRLKSVVRPHDHVVRLGGDEFLVLLELISSRDEAADVAKRILEAMKPSISTAAGLHSVGISIGISIFPSDGTNAGTLLNNADLAMYSAKTAGKRMFAFYDPQTSTLIRARHQMQQDLSRALKEDELVVWYQPRYDLRSGSTTSVEALVRWMHPVRGMIEPSQFISLAEETGLIAQLGEQVIDKVCAQVAAWRQSGESTIPVSVNVSAYQFRNADLSALLSHYLQRYRISSSSIEVELTESSMIDDTEQVAATLNALRTMGVKLLVDDFGTGYSSLSQLQSLRFDMLKVDRAFTRQLESSKEGITLFRAIITMAHELDMRVVAEGVETPQQFKLLRSLDCDEVQGFYISRPVPAAGVSTALRDFAVPLA